MRCLMSTASRVHEQEKGQKEAAQSQAKFRFGSKQIRVSELLGSGYRDCEMGVHI